MLQSLGWPTCKKEQRLVIFYKIVNKIACIQTGSLAPADSRARFRFDHVWANCDCSVSDTHFSSNNTWLEQLPVWHSGSLNFGQLQIEVSFLSGLTSRGINVIPFAGSCWLIIRIRNKKASILTSFFFSEVYSWFCVDTFQTFTMIKKSI